MTTKIDNNQRVFLLENPGFLTRKVFCNLKEIPKVLREHFEPHEQIKIYEHWNRKFKVCSKKFLNEMFTANQIDFRIK